MGWRRRVATLLRAWACRIDGHPDVKVWAGAYGGNWHECHACGLAWVEAS